LEIGFSEFVTYETYYIVVDKVKQQPSIVVEQLIIELEIQFCPHELMDTLKVIYPQYSLQEDLESKFGKHLNTIIKTYYAPREVEPTKIWDVPLLDATTLDLQRFTFVLSMKNNSQTNREPPHDFNPLI
jgi:hypothetical protein